MHEDSIALDGDLPKSQRAALLEPMVQPSIRAAAEQGYSLALIRPRNALFYFRTRSHSEIEQQKGAFRRAAAQTSFLDRELAALEPTPFEFRFKFEDETKHDFESGDWESHAMFYKARRRGESEKQVLDRMSQTFNVEYPQAGMVFAIGNQVARRHVWQLLGVIRLDEPRQASLPL